MDTKEILDRIQEHESSALYKQLEYYKSYYQAQNPELMERWRDRNRRDKTPNWKVPTPYFSTVVDTMAGYMFSDVQYSTDEAYQETLLDILEANNIEVKDMRAGTFALAYNRAYELIYTVGDENTTEIRIASLDPLQVTPIYADTIDESLKGIIWKRKPRSKTYEYLVDYIDADIWERYGKQANSDRLELIEDGFENPRKLYLPKCPVREIRAEMIGDQSPFHVVLHYIAALDWAITGNSNEMDRIVDALLLLGRTLDDEDLKHADEFKALMGIEKDELTPQYITKDLSPEFRKYVTELLVNEIHKHSHVVDWYNVMGGTDASAKALQTRLFDMDMYSNRLEKIYKKGVYERLEIIGFLVQAVYGIQPQPVEVRFERTTPTDVEDKINVLKGVDWLSTQTKVEMSGRNWEKEKKRLEEDTPDIDLDAYMRGASDSE